MNEEEDFELTPEEKKDGGRIPNTRRVIIYCVCSSEYNSSYNNFNLDFCM